MPRKKKTTREITREESLEILRPLAEKEEFINFSGHRKFPHKNFGDNVYRFTINIMSLDLLISVMEHEQVENVFFTPSSPATGQGMDSISMIYKVYVKYHPVEE
tara:strand:+ start:147 stop:458 length:312 start_codon:yes stop_codon:yes gene_type:complete